MRKQRKVRVRIRFYLVFSGCERVPFSVKASKGLLAPNQWKINYIEALLLCKIIMITYTFPEQKDQHKIPTMHSIQKISPSLSGIYNLIQHYLLDFEQCKYTCTSFPRLHLSV